jgi:predicted MFS family arabinose efflux permease
VLPVTTLAGRLTPLRDRAVLRTVTTSALAMIACYTVFTYLSVTLTDVTHGSAALLATILLVAGGATVSGTVLAGRLTDRFGPRPVLLTALAVLTVVLVLAPLAVRSLPSTLAWAVVWGAAIGTPVVPQQHRLVSEAPHAAPVVLGLNSAAIYAGIGLGGAIGGLAQRWVSPEMLGLPAAVVAAVALLAARTRAATCPEHREPGRLSA